MQKETAILYDRVYQAHGSTSSPRPNFPFASVGVKESRAPEQPAAKPVQPVTQPGIAGSTTGPSPGIQPQPQPNPYMRGSQGGLSSGGGGGAAGSGVGGGTLGYNPSLMPKTGQPGITGYGTSPITQPLAPTKSDSMTGTAIMQPSFINTGPPQPGVMQPGVTQPGGISGVGGMPVAPPISRETTYPVDAPMTWNDPPTLKSKKVFCPMTRYICLCYNGLKRTVTKKVHIHTYI